MIKPKRYEALDGLRTFACIFVIANHVMENGAFQVSGFLFESFLARGQLIVNMFMTISAFGMCCGYYDKILNKQFDISSFYSKRYKKILPFLECFA